jgi:cytochrome c-type biogenesis protein CcmH/NrfG
VDGVERMRGLQVALTFLEDAKHSKAEFVCRKLVAQDHDDIEALLLLGLAIGMSGDADAAARVLNRVAQERRSHAHPRAEISRE